MTRTRRGFTLLEVMVAMAILTLGLTIILSSQAGLFAASRRVQDETYASNLLRCKMAEVELQLLQDGYSLVDQSDSGECCEGEGENTFRCEWVVETVELPQPNDFETDTEGEEGADGFDLTASTEGDEGEGAALSDPVSPLGEAASILNGTGLEGVAGVGDLAGTLGQSGASEGGGLIGMALGMVYPTLKPMLEASIRKVKVSVIWNEGKKERRFEVVQYVTNPLEGSLNPNAAEGVEELMEQMNGLMGTGASDEASESGDAQ